MTTNAGRRQVAIVTGASSGVELGITRALLQRGFSVVANSRTVSKSKELPAFSRALAMQYVAEGIRANTSLDRVAQGPDTAGGR